MNSIVRRRSCQTETRIKAEKVNARQQLNMASSKAQLELKREISRTQMELKKKLFEEVETHFERIYGDRGLPKAAGGIY